ncbi:hypothetical protein ACQB60_09325 [Actinomycetota bacterium Odt1-20B]
MAGWAQIGGLGVVVTLCPVGGAAVAAHIEALGVEVAGWVEVCGEEEPLGAEVVVRTPPAQVSPPPTPPAPAPGPAPRQAPPPEPPAQPAPSPDRPQPPRPPAPHSPTPPRVRELLVPVRLETAAHPPKRRPSNPPPPPGLDLPHYRAPADREREGGRSVVTTTMVVTTPAVLAAALLRPRSRSRSCTPSRSRPTTGGTS